MMNAAGDALVEWDGDKDNKVDRLSPIRHGYNGDGWDSPFDAQQRNADDLYDYAGKHPEDVGSLRGDTPSIILTYPVRPLTQYDGSSRCPR